MSSSGRDCVSCKKLLIPPTANFCAHCGAPQAQPRHSLEEGSPTKELCCLMPQDFSELENDKKQENQLTPNLPKVSLPMLDVPREKSMKVQFNAVIPLTLWEWEEGKSSVYMKFGHRDIGSWKHDIGPCTLHRGVGNGLFVVEHKISLDYEFLKDNQNGLSYKYVVYSPRSNSIGHQFEFLHGAPPFESIDNNRLLRIPQDKLKPGGYYRQFDTVILPDVKSNETKNTDNELWKSFDSSNLSAFVIPSPAVMRSLCMEIHLHAMKGIVINGIFCQDFSIQNALTAFQGLLNCVCVQWIEHKGKEMKWFIEGLGICIMEWFESVLHELLTSTTLESHLRIVSGVLTATCLRNLLTCNFIDVTVTEKMKRGLLQVMSLSLVNGKEDFEFLQGMLETPEIKKIVLDALLYYLSLDLKEDIHVITMINALPLYHFLSGLSAPNQISVKKAPCVLNLVTLNSLIENNPNIFEICCGIIFQLFQFDSQILILIPYINCQKDPFEVLPIELSIVWLTNFQSHVPKIYLSSVSDDKMELDFLKPMTNILQRIFIVEIKKFSILSCYSEAAIYVINSFKMNLDSSKNSEVFVTSMVSLLLHILYRTKKFDEETNDHLSLCQKLRHSTKELLADWVMCPNVVGGSFFGGEVEEKFQKLRKKEQELKFWEAILTLEFPAIEMKNELEALALTIISDRISNIPTPYLAIDAFISIETQKDIHNSLRSIFFTKTCDILGVSLSSITPETRPNSNLVVELIFELAKEKLFQSPAAISSAVIPEMAAVKKDIFFQATADDLKFSSGKIKRRKKELDEKESYSIDCTFDKNKEQGGMIAIRKDSMRTNEPIPESKDEIFNLPVSNLPMHQLDILHPSPDKGMKLQFNAVIQKSLWKWEEGKSLVYMRFGHKSLGDWKLDIGPCILLRDAGGGFHSVRYDMKINIDFIVSLKIGLPYKYVVYSPLIKVTKHQFEYLHGAPPYQGANTNRLLKVPKEKLVPGGFYRQFDTIILPETKVKTAKGTLKKVWDIISIAEPDDPTAITVPTPTVMRCQCMEIHLQPTRDILLSGDFKVKLNVAINGCVSLIQCAFLQWVEYEGCENRWEVPDIGSFLIYWIEALLVILNKQQSHAVTSAVILACCFLKLLKLFIFPESNELRVALLQAMSLSITNGEKELEFLRSMIGECAETKNIIIVALVQYLRTVIALQKHKNAIVIIKALPLYHFLCDFSMPYQQTFVSLGKITWGDTLLTLEKLQSTLRSKSGFVQKHKKEIQQLLLFDSKLLYIIPYICPLEDTVILCDMLPLELAIVWLIERLNLRSDTQNLRLSSVTDYKMNHCFMKPLVNILKRIYEKEITNFGVLVRYSDAAGILLESFQDKLNFFKNARILVKYMILLYLHILFKAKMFQDQANNQDTLCQCLTVSVRELLKDWVARKDVIGGSFFGASLKFAGTTFQELKKQNEELEFWKDILSIKFPADEMKSEFEAIVFQLVSDRISAIPLHELKIHLYVIVEDRKDIADSFRNIFITKALEALDNLFSLDTLKSQQLIKLLIKKRYSDVDRTQNVSFDDLLEWKMWPGILKVYNARVQEESLELEEWKLIVASAVNKLESICANVHNGEITVSDLSSLRANEKQMKKLCECTAGQCIQRSLKKRLKEFQQFELYTMKLKYFLSHIGKVLTGQYDLMNELQKNHNDKKINELCTTGSDGSCRVVCFVDARPLDPCLDGFFTISSKYSNDIFNRLWHKKMSEQPAAFDFSKMYLYVLKPTFQTCTLLLKKLQTGDMTLVDVDDQFKHVYFNKLDKLEKDLINLQLGVDTFNQSISDRSTTWIKNAVVRIGQYWDFWGCREAAEAFLKIRDTYKLTGDFAKVEIASKVLHNSTTLSSIDYSVVDAGKFLQEYANDPKKVQCLVVFAECQSIVEWLKKDTKDLTNLVTFVSSSVAGREGSMTADKLLFLYTIGSGFSPLIYRLTKDASCQKLQELCKTLWVTLETTPYLPDLLKSCERNIDWYKSFRKKYETKMHLR